MWSWLNLHRSHLRSKLSVAKHARITGDCVRLQAMMIHHGYLLIVDRVTDDQLNALRAADLNGLREDTGARSILVFHDDVEVRSPVYAVEVVGDAEPVRHPPPTQPDQAAGGASEHLAGH